MNKARLFFASLLVLGGLSGCIRMPDDVNEATENIDWDVDLSQPIKLRGIYPTTGISGFGVDDSAKIIKETTGYDVAYEELSSANADNDVSNIFLNQDKYHFLKLTEAQYHPNAKDGTLLDLTPLLEKTESGRILKELIGLTNYGWDATSFTNSNGKKCIYAVPDFGYCVMEDTAFVWNTSHLKEIGYVDDEGNARTPESLTEFTDALNKLQAKYGASNDTYHALALAGSNAVEIPALLGAFECPNAFYLNDQGKITQNVFSDTQSYYVEYLHELRNNGIINKSWQNSDNAGVINDFSEGRASCVSLAYWWVESLVNGIVAKGKVAEEAGIENNYQSVHDKALIWNTRIRGDGSHHSVNQTKARHLGGDDGVSYYTAIPYYMAKDAVYTIDFLAKKMLYFSNYYGGTSLSLEEIANMKRDDGTPIDETWIQNNVHWRQIETPEGAKDYYPVGDYGFQEFEDMSEKIIYLRPYTHKITYEIDPALPHDVKDGETLTTKLNNETTTQTLNGTTMTRTVSGGGIWVQLTPRYMTQIVDNSQYCNGTLSPSANTLFHLRETGFDAWQVTVPMDETIILNPMTMMPPMPHWAPISILSRTVAKRGLATAIDCAASTTPTKALEVTRQALLTTYKKGSDGERYYYWSEEISNEMTEWYNNVKLKRS